MTPRLEKDGDPLVVHVIPSPRGRGAQRAARLLVDRLNEQHGPRHCLLGLFDGPPEVALDVAVGHPGGSRPAEGFDPRLALRLRRVLAALHPAAVVAHGGDAMKYALPATLGTRCPVVYCVIGTYAGRSAILRDWMWRRVMASATLVVAVGAEVLDECTGRFRVPTRKAIMIPNGRDATLFHPRSSPGEADPATLIFVGALTAQKQPDRFVQVVGQLRREGRDVRAVIVGDGPLAPTLEAMAAASGVDLFGAREDVPELLRDSDVLVFTSRPAGEGMPGVLIEAGLSGIPAVSTPVPGATAVLGEGSTGIVVEDSVAAIAAAVGDLVDDPARRTTMGASARIRCVSEFGLDVMAERWDAALRPLLEGQTGTAHPGTRTIDRVGAFLERFSVRPVADRARRR